MGNQPIFDGILTKKDGDLYTIAMLVYTGLV